MPDEIADRVIGVIAKTQHLPVEKISAESTFQDLQIDSLDGIQIIFAVESEFDVTVPDEAANSIRSVKEMIEGVRKLVEAKQGG
jgi:acyl carrier protein